MLGERRAIVGLGGIESTCPYCRRVLRVPEEYIGIGGTCNHCGNHITIVADPLSTRAKVLLSKVRKNFRQRTRFEEVLGALVPIQFTICRHPAILSIDEGAGDLSVVVRDEVVEDAGFECRRWDHPPTPPELKKFLQFFLYLPHAPRMVAQRRWDRLLAACEAYFQIHGPKDAHGRLAQEMQCIGFELAHVRCERMTKHRSGRCRQHRDANSRTMWNGD